MRSHEILKSLYIHCHNACGYQTWQGGNIQWGTSFHNIKVLRSCGLAMSQEILDVISLLRQGILPPNLARWCLTMRSFHTLNHTTLWTHGHQRSQDKLKTYLQYFNAYGSPNLTGLLCSMRSLFSWCKVKT